MHTRRVFIASALAVTAAPAIAGGGFTAFLAGLRADARGAGISAATFNAAFAGVTPNARVLELDHHQPEFTMTFAQYRARVMPQSRIDAGRAAFAANSKLLRAVDARYPADPRVVAGIWGLESGFGAKTGNFRLIEALATLAYDGRRANYFRTELLKALRILEEGDITPAAMTGSWAGAMGQSQFMPSSYLAYAVDFDGDGKRDIWHSRADVFASISNYIMRSGWHAGEPWGQAIQLPRGFNPAIAGRENPRSLGAWRDMGVRRIDGGVFSRGDVRGAVVIPDGAGGDAFMVYRNFAAIRKYNPSDYYALGVGLLGNACA